MSGGDHGNELVNNGKLSGQWEMERKWYFFGEFWSAGKSGT